MSTQTSLEASAKQVTHLLGMIDGRSRDEVQNLVRNGDLLKQMLTADLDRVDRQAFSDVLKPKATASSSWFTPVGELVERITARPKSEGFSRRQLDQLRRALEPHYHAGQYQPVSVDLWYGSLAATRDATITWFADESRGLGLDPYDYLSNVKLNFYPGSEYTGNRRLDACGLDLLAHYDPKDGIVPKRILKPAERWPGFVVLQLLNLNPQLITKLGTDEFPPYGLMMPGLVAGGGSGPVVRRGRRGVGVDCFWAGDAWRNAALPRFRELQY